MIFAGTVYLDDCSFAADIAVDEHGIQIKPVEQPDDVTVTYRHDRIGMQGMVDATETLPQMLFFEPTSAGVPNGTPGFRSPASKMMFKEEIRICPDEEVFVDETCQETKPVDPRAILEQMFNILTGASLSTQMQGGTNLSDSDRALLEDIQRGTFNANGGSNGGGDCDGDEEGVPQGLIDACAENKATQKAFSSRFQGDIPKAVSYGDGFCSKATAVKKSGRNPTSVKRLQDAEPDDEDEASYGMWSKVSSYDPHTWKDGQKVIGTNKGPLNQVINGKQFQGVVLPQQQQQQQPQQPQNTWKTSFQSHGGFGNAGRHVADEED